MVKHIAFNVFQILQELDDGITSHTSWMKNVHRALVCDGDLVNPDDLLPDAHHRCEFGCWYDGVSQPELKTEPGFSRIGDLHHAMHQATTTVLRQKLDEGHVNVDNYDAYMNGAIEFKMEVRRLQFKLMKEVCAIDHLTGVWNRQTMFYKLAEEHERATRGGHSSIICMVDIDHFKHVNDTHGHGVGDVVLQVVSQMLSQSLRKYDAIFRYGGEEFLICLPTTTVDEGLGLLERLRLFIAANPVTVNKGIDIPVTASFGISAMESEKSVEETIEQADHALLCAKTSGRNRICAWGRLHQE